MFFTMRPSTAAAVSCLLALLEPVAALTIDTSKLNPVDIFQLPSTPELVLIPEADLPKLAAPFMPPFVNGLAKVPSFRPPALELAMNPKTRLEILTKPDTDPFDTGRFDAGRFDTGFNTGKLDTGKLGQTVKGLKGITPRTGPLAPRNAVLDELKPSFPHSTIGKVFLRNGTSQLGFCSGTAVAENLVLTANHCVPRSNSREWTLEFVPAFNAKAAVARPFGSAFAVKCAGVKNAALDGTDYSVCLLNKAIGPTVGWMGWQAWADDASYVRGDWSSVGYPDRVEAGVVPAYEAPVKIDTVSNSGVDGKLLLSRPYVAKGWSGGPLFGWSERVPYIAGVVIAAGGTSVGDEVYADTAYHAGGKRLAELIQWSRNKLTA